jgi:hypothetical protein
MYYKTIFFLMISILIVTSLAGCNGNKIDNPMSSHSPMPDADTIFLETASSIRELAWNQLSNEEQKSVTSDWKEAKVSIVKWDDVPLKNKTYEPESIYKVTFTTNTDELLGTIGIYFDPVTKEIVGYDARK